MAHTEDMLRRQRHASEIQVTSYDATVANNPSDAFDECLVTLDADDPPRQKISVRWRPRINLEGPVERVFPEKGMDGVVIFPDEGEPWLIW
jgi:hypothetical protein